MELNRPFTITDAEFQLLSKFIYEQSGINLAADKKSLLVSRLQGLLVKYNLKSFMDYYEHVKNDAGFDSLTELLNNISTNHTYFYRENAHFTFFEKTALPTVMNAVKMRDSHDLRIWSAGCSSGEEPYTLVMIMLEALGGEYNFWDAGVLATDISLKILEEAEVGVYTNDRLLNIPPLWKAKYFAKLNGDKWAISDKIKKEVKFKRFNLMHPNFPFKKRFQIIFCRNVMIYFDEPTRDVLVEKFADSLEIGGYLFIGHSETIKKNSMFKYVRPAVYQRI